MTAPWSDKTWHAFVTHIRAGASGRQAAQAVRRTYKAACLQALARGTTINELRVGYVWTFNQLTGLFGVSWKAINLWRVKGWLVPSPHNEYTHSVTRATILAFLAVREAWPFYDTEKITDPDIAAAARFERIRSGGRWVRASDWARAHHYRHTYAAELVREGVLPATKIGYAWHVWEATQ